MATGEQRVRVFVSYRRDETRHIAGRLGDRLRDHFELFMDTDTIYPGMNYSAVLRQEAGKCNVLVAVIGLQWMITTGPDGKRRIDDPNDWVRQEIQIALERDALVIPVLVDGASMPTQDGLPAALAGLADRQALAVRHESFTSDMNWLVDVITRQTRTPLAQGEATAPDQGEELAPQPVKLQQDKTSVLEGTVARTSVATESLRFTCQAGAHHTLTVRWARVKYEVLIDAQVVFKTYWLSGTYDFEIPDFECGIKHTLRLHIKAKGIPRDRTLTTFSWESVIVDDESVVIRPANSLSP